jgi:hypothetical protein
MAVLTFMEGRPRTTWVNERTSNHQPKSTMKPTSAAATAHIRGYWYAEIPKSIRLESTILASRG